MGIRKFGFITLNRPQPNNSRQSVINDLVGDSAAMEWKERDGVWRTPAPRRPGVVFAEVKPSVVVRGHFVGWVYRRHCKSGAIGISKINPMGSLEGAMLACEEKILSELAG